MSNEYLVDEEVTETDDSYSPNGEKRKPGRPRSEGSARAWGDMTRTSERTASRVKRGLAWLALHGDGSVERVVALMARPSFRKSWVEKLARRSPDVRALVLTHLEAGMSWYDALARALDTAWATNGRVVTLITQPWFRKSWLEELATLIPGDRDALLHQLECGLSWDDAIDWVVEEQEAARGVIACGDGSS
jgi:hypothetical protein